MSNPTPKTHTQRKESTGNMRSIAVLLGIFALLHTTLAVKSELFKTCAQSGFCHRNRHYAQAINKSGKSYYSIDETSVQFGYSSVTGDVVKFINATHLVKLPFQLDVLESNNIRLRIDEDRGSIQWDNELVRKERYSGAHAWAFQSEPKLTKNYELDYSNVGFIVKYGPQLQYSVEVTTKNFEIRVKYHDEVQMVLNERKLLNVEHFRTEDQNSWNIHPEESSFDSFEDSFKDSKDDTLPFGPESVALDVTFNGFSHVYGLPEHADTLVLKDTTDGEPYRLYNVDIFEYETDSRLSMYGAIPLLMAHKQGLSTGIFWINGADTYVDIERTSDSSLSSSESTRTHWMSENGIIDLVVLIGESPEHITKNYATLTGNTPLPQLFSLGYHQCRWNYNDEEDVLSVHANMDKFEIPYDTIWLDIEYTDAKKYFTWKHETFPDPVGMMKQLAVTGRNLVTIIDPHIKTGYEVSSHLESHELALLNTQGDAYHGHCWPGESIWIDSFEPEAVDYWSTLFANGTSFSGDATNLHIWNDMNEPSVFSGPETTCPRDIITHESVEIRSTHNIYGLSYHQATFEAMKNRYRNKRPFILTRSYFAGSQRTSAMWTGDNMSKWEYLKISIPMILTQNMVSMPFSGADVGGFFGDPTKELLTRWYQAGIWYPFFRAHAHIDSRRREPWLSGEPYTSMMRDAIKMRYSLLPLWYTKFYESSLDGSSVVTPMFYKFPENEDTFNIEDALFIGGLLVKPVTEEGATTQAVYLPDDSTYYDYLTFEPLQGIGEHTVSAPLDKIPVFIKAGSITPRKDRYRRSSKLMRYDPYTLIIALDSQGEAQGTLYIDDGETYDYQRGEFVYLDLSIKDGVLSSMVLDGVMDVKNKLEKVIIIGGEVHSGVVSQGGDTWNTRVVVDGTHTELLNPGVVMGKPWSITL